MPRSGSGGATAAMAPPGTGGGGVQEQQRPMTLTSDVVAGLPSSLLSSSSPLSAEALDAALEAQRSSARLVENPDSAPAFASRAHALVAAGHLDRAAHEFGLALRLTRASAASSAVAFEAAAAAPPPAPQTPSPTSISTSTSASAPLPSSSSSSAATHAAAAEAVLCACRSATFSRLAAATRAIPAAQSEARALFGLDPTHLAELALRDASRARALAPQWPAAAARAGDALHLLERFGDARAAFLDALELDPSASEAVEGLKRAEEALLAEEVDERQTAPATATATAAPPVSVAAAASRLVSSSLRLDDADCAVCSRLLYQPVTTPCGHSFCRGCLARARDHRATRCPMCRATMHVASGREAPQSTALAALLERAFPEEYAARRKEEEEAALLGEESAAAEEARARRERSEAVAAADADAAQAEAAEATATAEAAAAAAGGAGDNSNASASAASASASALPPRRNSSSTGEAETATLPLFVMACMLPGEHMALNIFEPRYRLMVRRVMEGSRRFGMATVDPRTGRLRRVGCEAEVLECQPQPDGRFYLEIVGRRRFRIGEDWETDGYRVCSARFFRDSPPPDAAAAAEVASLSSSVEALADAWVKRARAAGRADARVLDVLARAGDKPPPGRHEALSFWVSNLIPTGGDRAWAAAETDTRARLARQLAELRALGAPDGGDGAGGDGNVGCCVM